MLKHLSQPTAWGAVEQALTERSIDVYELPTEVIRCDATTVSGYHDVVDGGLFQFGHSKDDPSRAQIKLMTGSLDPPAVGFADKLAPRRWPVKHPRYHFCGSFISKKELIYLMRHCQVNHG